MNKLAWYMHFRKLLWHYRKQYRREKRMIAKYGGSTKLLEVYEDAIHWAEYRIERLKNEKVLV